MFKYRKRPVIIEAFKYDGDFKDTDGNWYVPDWAIEAVAAGLIYYDSVEQNLPPCELFIKLESECVSTQIKVGDFIIKGIAGKIYTCKANIFEATYIKTND